MILLTRISSIPLKPQTKFLYRYVQLYFKCIRYDPSYGVVIDVLLIIGCVETNPGPINPKPSSISIVHNNVCSLSSKVDIVSAELSNFDIIGISETHLDNTIDNDSIAFEGFHLPLRNDRNRYGGGVALYIANHLAFIERNDLSTPGLEILWSEIHTNHKKILVGVLYRPPNMLVDYWNLFCSNLEKVFQCDLPVILLGDFNVNVLCEQSTNFKFMIQRLGLMNLIHENTNFTVHTGTCIDLILTNNSSLVSESFILPPFCSTHSVIGAELRLHSFKQFAYKRKIRDYKLANYDKANDDIKQINWEEDVFNGENIDDIYNSFLNKLNTCLDKHIPLKNITVRPKDKAFMNNSIRKLMRKRNRLHRKAVKTQNPTHWTNYRYIRNRVIDEIRCSRDRYNKKLTSQIDKTIPPGKWWRIIKSLTKLTNSYKPLPPIKSSGQTLFHPIEKANVLNNYFADISSLDDEPDIPLHGPGPPNHMENFFITDEEVLDQIKILNLNKPPGPDGISPVILKNISHSILKPLTKMFNLSLHMGELPSIWKISHITPVYKNKGSAQEVNNYRPISITSVICKILEKIIFKHMYNYLVYKNIIYKYQSGFQPCDSTTNQLVEIYNTVISNLDKGKDVRFIFCDISKAFDRVWHKGILYKLKLYGINNQVTNWVENYLMDRKQKVVLDGFSSSFRATSSGVPQGSVLGPFLFLLYINDMPKDVSNNIRLFADDTSLYVIVDNDMKTAANSLTIDLDKISKWSDMWAVDFNPSKTKNLDFTRKHHSHPPVTFGAHGPPVNKVESHTHLGINFQSDGGWKSHIKTIHEKACKRLNLLRLVKFSLGRDSLKKIYFAFIRPVLEYADTVWDNCNENEDKLLEDIQVAAARIMSGLRINSSRSALYNELGLDPLSIRRKVHKLILFYKMVHGLAPEYLQELLIPCRQNSNTYSLRHQDDFKFVLPRVKTTAYMNSFLPSTIKLWNDLPFDIRTLPTVSAFKKSLKNIFLRKPNKLYDYGRRKLNIIHCQLRNKASNLNADLFNHYLRENSNCENCDSDCENSSHFFFECPIYDVQRQSFLESLNNLHLSVPISLNLLLHGDSSLPSRKNIALFEVVQKFILSTKRLNH